MNDNNNNQRRSPSGQNPQRRNHNNQNSQNGDRPRHQNNQRPQGQTGQGQNSQGQNAQGQNHRGQQAPRHNQVNQSRNNPQGGRQEANGQGPASSGPSRNNNRRRNNRKNRYGRRPNAPRAPQGPVPLSERRPPHLDRAYEKYQNLLDQHLIARKKYFELFYRADYQQKAKLERNFYQTLFDLRDFEEKATPEIKDFLKIKTNGRSEDYIYSENHALEKVGKLEIEGEKFEDPHFLPSQARADYAEDTEESSGTLDDYKNYKGL